MKHLFRISAIAGVALSAALDACSPKDDDDNNTSSVPQEWIDNNDAYYNEQAALLDDAGKPYYTVLTPPWNSQGSVLIHWYNDRALTEGNLSPMINSTVKVKYIGSLYNGTVFDSSYNLGTDSLFTTRPVDVIEGWAVALSYMHVGDTVRVVIPSAQGYGTAGTTTIPGYSTLVFGLKLVSIPDYETN